MYTIDFTRRQGSADVLLVEQTSKRHQTYIVRTDIQPYQTEEAVGATFIQIRFDYRPTMTEVRDFVISVINKQTDDRILSGFRWIDKPVWLSEENQRNFSEAQRVAQIAPDTILPATFKLGEDSEGRAVYHEFLTADELTDFYLAIVKYINLCLQEGWQKKDSYDFSEYERQLEGL